MICRQIVINVGKFQRCIVCLGPAARMGCNVIIIMADPGHDVEGANMLSVTPMIDSGNVTGSRRLWKVRVQLKLIQSQSGYNWLEFCSLVVNKRKETLNRNLPLFVLFIHIHFGLSTFLSKFDILI